MPDYRRLVSYIYNYEDGKKRNNVGYARVEARNGQCKCTIHINAVGFNDRSLSVYMFQRKKARLNGVLIGKLLVRNGIGDFRINTDPQNIMNSSHPITDIGGIVLYHTGEKYLATVWDDDPLTKDMVATLENKANLSLVDEADNEVILSAESEQIVMAQFDQSIPQKESNILNGEEKDISEQVLLDELEQNKGSFEEAILEDVEIPDEDNEDKEYYSEQDEVYKVDIEVGNEANSEANNEVNYDANNEVSNEVINEKLETNADTNNEENIELSSIEEDTLIQANDCGCNNSENISPNLNQWQNNYTNNSINTEHPLAQKLYNNYPKMHPFEDNEVLWCVRIEPQDLGVFPVEAWPLANNSFLLHGYYGHRHLIFAKVNNKNSNSYIIGVPGIYHNREKFMAKMFGFENFKCAKRRDRRIGEFGYWYVPINLK